MKLDALKPYIYRSYLTPAAIRSPSLENCVEQIFCYVAELIRIQRLINLRIGKSYHTVSNEVLCLINGIILINFKILYEITKGIGTSYVREMEMENRRHPATQVKINEEYEDISHPIQAYTIGA